MILIRGAVTLFLEYDWNAWSALLVSTLGTSVLMVIYFTFFYGRLTKKRTKISYLRRRFAISFVLVGFFVLHGVIFFTMKQSKTSEVQKEFHSLHPILRLGSSTIFLLDRKAIMTDAARVPEDYKKMGLPTAKNSLHYKQKDGYVYALDIRTKGRPEWSNLLLKTYFNTMGFNTIRHVGTADHLHISLSCPYLKGAK